MVPTQRSTLPTSTEKRQGSMCSRAERVSGTNLLWVWCALLVVCAPLAWRAWRLERNYDLRVTREVARFIETGELPAEDGRRRSHRVLGLVGVVAIFLTVDALLDAIF